MNIRNLWRTAVLAAVTVVLSGAVIRASQTPAATNPALAGVALDAVTRLPVGGAVVSAGDASATTDAAGRFRLTVPRDATTVKVEAPGYYPLSLEIAGPDAPRSDVELLLVARAAVAESVLVQGAVPTAAPAHRVIAPVEVLRTPGALDNVFRALQVMPGVSATIEIGGYLSVRGGAPDQNLTLLDGVEVHDPYRLYGLASAFNPETVDRFNLASGGFSAKYGDRLSSMLSIDTRDGTAARAFAGSASMSVTDANVVTEGRFPRGSWLMTGRRTYYDAVARLVSDQNFPGFVDGQAKVVVRPRPSQMLTLFGLTSRQGGDLQIEGDDLEAQVYDDTANDLAWARFEWAIGTRGHVRTLAAYSDTRVRSGFDASLDDEGRRSNAPGERPSRRAEVTFASVTRVRDLSSRHETGWVVGRHTLETGVETHRLTTSLDFGLTGDRNQNAGNGSSLQGGVGLPERLVSRLDHTRAAGWLEGTWTLADGLSAMTGLRVDRVGLTGEVRVSPRASATWTLTPSTRLRAAAGRYTQSPGYEKLVQGDYLLDLTDARRRGLTSQSAVLASLGAERDLHGGASLRVEGYYKRFSDVLTGQLESDAARSARLARYDFPASLASSLPTAPIITSVPDNSGRGRAYGVDVQLSRMSAPAGGRLRGWASYTWGKAERDAYGLRFPFEYDRRHAATVVAAYQLGPRWELAATARAASGFPRTAPLGLRVAGMEDVDDGDGDGNVAEIVPERDADGRWVYTADFGGVENLQRGRLPYFARVDARITWRQRSGRWEFYGEILNVTNRRNAGQLSPTLTYDPTSDQPRIVETPSGWIPLLPTVGVRVRF